jgi:hypothetical protein
VKEDIDRRATEVFFRPLMGLRQDDAFLLTDYHVKISRSKNGAAGL